MGLIKKIFGGFFAFIGGLFGSLGKLVGIGKSDYYLELDEAATGNKSEAPVAAKAAVAPEASAKANTQPKASKKPVPAGRTAPTPVPKAKQVPTPTLVEGELPVAQASANGSKKTGTEPTFATDYLVNPRLSNGGRRRPGPSLSPFKDMAKQVKTPFV
ncbi:MAG: hypothetical protein AAF215_19570 [Cyanobacteria bacterium P01_A01_bin.123]